MPLTGHTLHTYLGAVSTYRGWLEQAPVDDAPRASCGGIPPSLRFLSGYALVRLEGPAVLLGAGLTDVEAQGCSFRTIATRGVGEHQDLLTGGHGDGQPPMAGSEWISGAAPRRFTTLPIRCGPSGETSLRSTWIWAAPVRSATALVVTASFMVG